MIDGRCRIWVDGRSSEISSVAPLESALVSAWCAGTGRVVRVRLGRVVLASDGSDASAVSVETGGGNVVCSPDTLFVLGDRSFKAARDVRPGDRMMGRDARALPVVERVSDVSGQCRHMYDVLVPGKHNFLCEGVVIKCRA